MGTGTNKIRDKTKDKPRDNSRQDKEEARLEIYYMSLIKKLCVYLVQQSYTKNELISALTSFEIAQMSDAIVTVEEN